ncbi:hypothetical protein NS14008_07015 [Nocardia seriolae]|nr:hypothetical protein [Nocardia seriolae]OJF79005.1 hypothetical protein NS14008_07015 [Nocardia seriolae]WNJ57646.1 hypothetical protein RMO66_30240 [Nocardia seriolae]
MVGPQSVAEALTDVAGRGLDEQVLDVIEFGDDRVGDAVERHTAGQADAADSGFGDSCSYERSERALQLRLDQPGDLELQGCGVLAGLEAGTDVDAELLVDEVSDGVGL